MSAASPLLTVRDLSVVARTGSGTATVLDQIDLSLARGEVLGIVGESGSGKSTLCRALARILPDSLEIASGDVTLAGRDLISLGAHEVHLLGREGLGMVFQDPAGALNPVMRVGDQIVEAILARGDHDKRAAVAEALALLERMGIPDPEERFSAYPHEFSGGQQQRLVIGIALAGGMTLLLADEPTSALDVRTQAQILELIRALSRQGLGVLLVSHDFAVVAQICSRVLVLYAGRVCEIGPTGDLLTQPRHPYTKALVGALPDIARARPRLDVIRGQHPVVGSPVPGCPFHPRCEHAVQRCERADVPLKEVGDGRESTCIRVEEIWPEAEQRPEAGSRPDPAPATGSRLAAEPREGEPMADEPADLIFFNGTVMRGEPDHANLSGAAFVAEATTAAGYRLFSIGDRYPAMVPRRNGGVAIEGELYRVPASVWPEILEAEPPGLGRDFIELSDGSVVYGIVGSEDLVAEKGSDISAFGGWRTYLRHLGSGQQGDPQPSGAHDDRS